MNDQQKLIKLAQAINSGHARRPYQYEYFFCIHCGENGEKDKNHHSIVHLPDCPVVIARGVLKR